LPKVDLIVQPEGTTEGGAPVGAEDSEAKATRALGLWIREEAKEEKWVELAKEEMGEDETVEDLKGHRFM